MAWAGLHTHTNSFRKAAALAKSTLHQREVILFSDEVEGKRRRKRSESIVVNRKVEHTPSVGRRRRREPQKTSVGWA